MNIYINDGFCSKPFCWSREGTQLWDQQRGPKSRVGMFSKKNVLQLPRSRNQWKINPAISQLVAVSLSCSSIFKADDAHPFKDHCETPADKLRLQTQRARVKDWFSHEHHHLSSFIWGNNSHTHTHLKLPLHLGIITLIYPYQPSFQWEHPRPGYHWPGWRHAQLLLLLRPKRPDIWECQWQVTQVLDMVFRRGLTPMVFPAPASEMRSVKPFKVPALDLIGGDPKIMFPSTISGGFTKLDEHRDLVESNLTPKNGRAYCSFWGV